MSNSKCYIAGKITGLDWGEVVKKFNEAETEMAHMGFDPVNPITASNPEEKTWEGYMKAGLIEMMQCSTVYALNDWRESKGATIEIHLAVQLGIDIIHQEGKTVSNGN